MSEAQGYEIDIFLSYSRRDNEPIGSRPGWVDVFHESLENWLVKRRGLENLKIWRDTAELHGNTDFDDAIGGRLKGTALFFVLNSRNYPKSDYCQKELGWFHRFNSERPGGLKIGEQHRIFNILLNNIPHGQWPDAVQGAVGFPMHDSEGKNSVGDFTLPEDDTFVRQLHRIVNAVEETMGVFAKTQPPPVTTREKRSDAVQVFIADAADSLFQKRERLVADLQDRGIEIFAEVPPPMEAAAHSDRISEVLDKAALSVHLLDQWPGRRILDKRDTTYTREQIDVALDSEVPQLIWIPPELKLDAIEDSAYREFVEELETGKRGEKHYEVVRSPLADFTEIISQKIAQAESAAEDGDEESSILVDTHQKDQRFGFKIADLLAEKGAEVEFNQESVDPVRSLEQFEYAVRHVKNLVIMFGKVAPEWLLARIKKAVRIAAEQFSSDEGNVLEGIWVYALPGAENVPNFPRIPFQIEVLDNSQSDSIDLSVMSPLLGA